MKEELGLSKPWQRVGAEGQMKTTISISEVKGEIEHKVSRATAVLPPLTQPLHFWKEAVRVMCFLLLVPAALCCETNAVK